MKEARRPSLPHPHNNVILCQVHLSSLETLGLKSRIPEKPIHVPCFDVATPVFDVVA